MVQAKVLEAQAVIPKFYQVERERQGCSSVVLIYTQARIPMSPLVFKCLLLLFCLFAEILNALSEEGNEKISAWNFNF